jgi:hypothetical protein
MVANYQCCLAVRTACKDKRKDGKKRVTSFVRSSVGITNLYGSQCLIFSRALRALTSSSLSSHPVRGPDQISLISALDHWPFSNLHLSILSMPNLSWPNQRGTNSISRQCSISACANPFQLGCVYDRQSAVNRHTAGRKSIPDMHPTANDAA